jgi:hypothetical protein
LQYPVGPLLGEGRRAPPLGSPWITRATKFLPSHVGGYFLEPVIMSNLRTLYLNCIDHVVSYLCT